MQEWNKIHIQFGCSNTSCKEQYKTISLSKKSTLPPPLPHLGLDAIKVGGHDLHHEADHGIKVGPVVLRVGEVPALVLWVLVVGREAVVGPPCKGNECFFRTGFSRKMKCPPERKRVANTRTLENELRGQQVA